MATYLKKGHETFTSDNLNMWREPRNQRCLFQRLRKMCPNSLEFVEIFVSLDKKMHKFGCTLFQSMFIDMSDRVLYMFLFLQKKMR